MAVTTVKIRVSGNRDAWYLHECTYEDGRLLIVRDWETYFPSREEAATEGRSFAAYMAQKPIGVEYVFDGDMPPGLVYDPYSGIPIGERRPGG